MVTKSSVYRARVELPGSRFYQLDEEKRTDDRARLLAPIPTPKSLLVRISSLILLALVDGLDWSR